MSLPFAAMTEAFCEISMRLVALSVELPKSQPRGAPAKTLTDPLKYIDLDYHEKAFGKR